MTTPYHRRYAYLLRGSTQRVACVGWLKKRVQRLEPEAQWVVIIESEGIRVSDYDRQEKFVAKDELSGVAIETNDTGPWGPQGRRLFPNLTVDENLAMGGLRRPGGAGVHWDRERIFEYFPRVRERLASTADVLSGGERQMVAIARAIAGDVRLLLLDEPFEGLAPAVTEEIFKTLDALRGEIPILIIEHDLDLVLALADRAYMLDRGRITHAGPGRAAARRSRLPQAGAVVVMKPASGMASSPLPLARRSLRTGRRRADGSNNTWTRSGEKE